MEREILVEDGIGGEHMIKYLDENRVIVQKVQRYVGGDNTEEYVSFGMPGKVKLYDIDSWPFTEELKLQIQSFHSRFAAAE